MNSFSPSSRPFQLLRPMLLGLGSLTLANFVYGAWQSIYNYGFRSHDLTVYGAGEGAWAIVTGASRGIGRQFCLELAKAGFNIILAARTKEDLEKVEKEINENCPNVQTKIILFDATHTGCEEVRNFINSFIHLDIGMVVSNVAVINAIPTEVAEQSDEEITRELHANCLFTVLLAKNVTPILKRRKKSAFIMIGSLTSTMPMPLYTVYASTKAFLDHFAVGFSLEVAPFGVTVMTARPGLTVSDMSGIEQPSMFVAHPGTIARNTLNLLGTGIVSLPFFPNYLMQQVSRFIPVSFVGPKVLDLHQKQRQEMIALDKDKFVYTFNPTA